MMAIWKNQTGRSSASGIVSGVESCPSSRTPSGNTRIHATNMGSPTRLPDVDKDSLMVILSPPLLRIGSTSPQYHWNLVDITKFRRSSGVQPIPEPHCTQRDALNHGSRSRCRAKIGPCVNQPWRAGMLGRYRCAQCGLSIKVHEPRWLQQVLYYQPRTPTC